MAASKHGSLYARYENGSDGAWSPESALSPSAVLAETPRVLQGLAQQKLDLPVQAPQVVRRPLLQGAEKGGVDAKKEGLALGHSARP
jgi:hypothetical protein